MGKTSCLVFSYHYPGKALSDHDPLMHRRPGVIGSVAFMQEPSNIPGKYYIGLRVIAPANSATPPHNHNGSAVAATVIRGEVLNQTVCPGEDPNGQGSGPKIYKQGESWYEPPGCHHVRAENISGEEAEFIACFVIDKEKVDREGPKALVVIDAEVEEEEAKKKGSL